MTLKIPYLLAASMATVVILYLANPPGLSAAPVVTLETQDGRLFNLSKTGGKTRLISFFSPHCPISKRDVATLNAINDEYASANVEIVAVAMPYDDPQEVRLLREATDITYDVIIDSDGKISEAFPGVRFTPTTFLIDSSGNIVWRHTGRIKRSTLDAELQSSWNRIRTANAGPVS